MNRTVGLSHHGWMTGCVLVALIAGPAWPAMAQSLQPLPRWQFGATSEFIGTVGGRWRGLEEGPGVNGFIGFRLAREVWLRGTGAMSWMGDGSDRIRVTQVVFEPQYQAYRPGTGMTGFAGVRIGRLSYRQPYSDREGWLLGARVGVRLRVVGRLHVESGLIADVLNLRTTATRPLPPFAIHGIGGRGQPSSPSRDGLAGAGAVFLGVALGLGGSTPER
jgi:hypothetical protein